MDFLDDSRISVTLSKSDWFLVLGDLTPGLVFSESRSDTYLFLIQSIINQVCFSLNRDDSVSDASFDD